ncbi:MAG: FMN-binding protein [Spirochaetales bacterium]|nr:FMN-binding protein [Spirochaetales bacterium]
MKEGMKPRGARTLARVALISAALMAVLVAAASCATPDYGQRLAALPAIELSRVADGTWEGSAFLLPVSVKAAVRVEGGRIAGIELVRHFNGQGKPAEAIVDAVIAAQSVRVDAVAGATHSSVAILEAVADALSKGSAK